MQRVLWYFQKMEMRVLYQQLTRPSGKSTIVIKLLYELYPLIQGSSTVLTRWLHKNKTIVRSSQIIMQHVVRIEQSVCGV